MSQVYVAFYIMGERIDINSRYRLCLMFWVGNKAARSQIYVWLYILDIKTSTCNRPYCRFMLRFIFLVKEQVLIVETHCISCFTWVRRWPDLRYISGFIFWMGKQELATGQATDTCCALYCRWESKYW